MNRFFSIVLFVLTELSSYDVVAQDIDNAAIVTATSLNDGNSLAMSDYPSSARKGDSIVFSAKVEVFDKKRIGKGCASKYLNCWLVIDKEDVKLYRYKSTESGGNPTLEATEKHGLTIASMLNIDLVFNGVINVIIQSSGGIFQHTFDLESVGKFYNQKGEIKIISDGSILTDVQLSATNKDFHCPIWIFGASYTNVASNQMIGALKKLGYFNYYLHGYPGSTSKSAYQSLQKAFKYGTPKLLIWAIMSNDTDDTTWKSYAQKVINLCAKKGVEVVFVNYPDMRKKEFSVRRQWVIDGGYRYIDLVAAVQESAYVYDTDFWYSGMMGSDGVHPTSSGADAMAIQMITDCPEIITYDTCLTSYENPWMNNNEFVTFSKKEK